jgi:hypothetical protein
MMLKLTVTAGDTLTEACQLAQTYADACQAVVEFEFNGVLCDRHLGKSRSS